MVPGSLGAAGLRADTSSAITRNDLIQLQETTVPRDGGRRTPGPFVIARLVRLRLLPVAVPA
jgi:hypothetical protein